MNYLLLNTILSSNKRLSFKHLQSSGQLGRARSIMSNLNEIFKGGNKENNQSGSSDSGSSYDSSSSDDHNRNKSKKKANKTRTRIDTPIGQIELEPDAYRGAMIPENLSSNANRGHLSRQPLEEQVVDDGGITPGSRYNPDDKCHLSN